MMMNLPVATILLLAVWDSVSALTTQKIAGSRLSSSELFARKALITGNWKLNPETKEEAIALATGIADAVTSSSPADVAIFVPFPFLDTVQRIVGDKLVVGAEVSFISRSISLSKRRIVLVLEACAESHHGMRFLILYLPSIRR